MFEWKARFPVAAEAAASGGRAIADGGSVAFLLEGISAILKPETHPGSV
jgi:hypothetical protein